MSKGLEALNYIKGFVNERTFDAKYDNGDIDSWRFKTIGELFPDEFKIIETALKDYDLLKRSLNRNWVEVVNDEKKLKALEIIKKRFTIQFIESDLPNYYGIMQIGINPIYIKTKEELDLLKEILL